MLWLFAANKDVYIFLIRSSHARHSSVVNAASPSPVCGNS